MSVDPSDMKVVNPDVVPTPLTDAAKEDIAALALRQHKANGLLMKAVTYVGGQVEDTMRLLPKSARAQLDEAARRALVQSYDAAAKTRDGVVGRAVQSDRMHKVMASLSGALGGAGGLPTAIAEIPVATTMIFRAVQSVAAEYGEDPTTVETRVQCLAVFGSGGPGKEDDGIDTSFFGARLGITGAAVNGLISRVAPRFATILSQKLASQAVPILGAAAGAGTNYAFMQYYVEMAHVHFGLRKLARVHGEEAVAAAFHVALVACKVPVIRA